MTDLVPFEPDGYDIRETPLRGRSTRVDWQVVTEPGSDTGTLDRPSTTSTLRKLFADLYDEADRRKGDPIASGRALLNIETLLRDLRALQAKLRVDTAEAMSDLAVRTITVEHVGVWEASSSFERSNWQTGRLVAAWLAANGVVRLVDESGEYLTPEHAGALIEQLYGPSSAPRMTPLREAGIDPDHFCDVECDDDGRYLRTPTVRVRDNRTGATS